MTSPEPVDGVIVEGTEEDGSDSVLLATHRVYEITDTTLAERDAPKRQIMQELYSKGEDLGDGFIMYPQPALIQRDITGAIVRLVPFNELPGVEYHQAAQETLAEEKPVPATLPRAERQKLIDILAHRLFRYYDLRQHVHTMYNPFRDGLPDVPAGSPEHLEPLPHTKLYPATRGQVWEWLRAFVADRCSLLDRRRFGDGVQTDVMDLVVRIE